MRGNVRRRHGLDDAAELDQIGKDVLEALEGQLELLSSCQAHAPHRPPGSTVQSTAARSAGRAPQSRRTVTSTGGRLRSNSSRARAQTARRSNRRGDTHAASVTSSAAIGETRWTRITPSAWATSYQTPALSTRPSGSSKGRAAAGAIVDPHPAAVDHGRGKRAQEFRLVARVEPRRLIEVDDLRRPPIALAQVRRQRGDELSAEPRRDHRARGR
jgi:hypothetical protein